MFCFTQNVQFWASEISMDYYKMLATNWKQRWVRKLLDVILFDDNSFDKELFYA